MAEFVEKKAIRRLKRFLKGSPGKDIARTEPIRTAVIEVLGRATARFWKTYVVGGAIRDLLLGPTGTWPRDVDVVVDGCSPSELEAAFGDMLLRRNSFGGLHLQRTVDIDGHAAAKYDLLFDIWRLQDTWGLKARHLDPTISNFLTTPFLNIDSIAAALPVEGSHLSLYEHGFVEAVGTRSLEINSEPNPFPYVCAVRSLILAAKLDFWLGQRLATFIHTLMTSAPISELMRAQISHYGQLRCGEEDIKQWLSTLRTQLASGAQRVRLVHTPQLQMHLWQDWPPHSDLHEKLKDAGSSVRE